MRSNRENSMSPQQEIGGGPSQMTPCKNFNQHILRAHIKCQCEQIFHKFNTLNFIASYKMMKL